MTASGRKPSLGNRAWLLCAASIAVAGYVVGVDTSEGAALSNCAGGPGALQRMRDNLETASTYLKATKNNFGSGRQGAIDETAKAIEEFDRLLGKDRLEPAPATKIAQNVGEHGHPRMMLAWNVLDSTRKDLDNQGCLQEGGLEDLRRFVGKALEQIDDAFIFNPPWSRH